MDLRLRIPGVAGSLAIPRASVRRLDVSRGVSRGGPSVAGATGDHPISNGADLLRRVGRAGGLVVHRVLRVNYESVSRFSANSRALIIAGLGWRFWKGRHDITLLIIGAVQALFGIVIYINRFDVHG